MRALKQKSKPAFERPLFFCKLLIAISVATFTYTKDSAAQNYQRAISLAPSITETIFAIGAEANLKGVTRYCDYPPAAKKIRSIGGYLDPNYEEIFELKPDIIFILPEHFKIKKDLEKFGITLIPLNNTSIHGVLESISTLGKYLNKEHEAEVLRANLSDSIGKIVKTTAHLKHPSVLVSIGGHANTSNSSSIYIAGRNSFYNELIELAGGTNAYSDLRAPYANITAEGIIKLNPDIIIDLAPENDTTRKKGNWIKIIPFQSFFKNRRIEILDFEYLINPGPRFNLALEAFAKVIHPEVLSGGR